LDWFPPQKKDNLFGRSEQVLTGWIVSCHWQPAVSMQRGLNVRLSQTFKNGRKSESSNSHIAESNNNLPQITSIAFFYEF